MISMPIKCKYCFREVDETGFYESRTTGKILQPCKNCRSEKGKKYRSKHKAKIATRNRQWVSDNLNRLREHRQVYRRTPNGAWTQFQSHKRSSKHGFKFSKEEFIKWYSAQPQICYYCGLNSSEANILFQSLTLSKKRYQLQYDRKDSKKPYEPDNVVLACKICNDHKTDFFTASDFRVIARNYLGINLLNKVPLFEFDH